MPKSLAKIRDVWNEKKLLGVLERIRELWRTEGYRGFARRLVSLLPIAARKILFYGRRHYCPVCQSHVRRFWSAGSARYVEGLRPKSQCPVCGVGERHRLLWVFIQRQTDLLKAPSKTLLHISPEEWLEARFRQLPNLTYLSGDLDPREAMEELDVTDIQYPSDSFDVIVCSHVLEHVPDDRQAMREFYRVLKNKGYALVMVPITTKETFEDPSVTNPLERERLFGQTDHVRRYGLDIEDRLKEVGFNVKTFDAREVVTEHELDRLGVLLHSPASKSYHDSDIVFFCKKE